MKLKSNSIKGFLEYIVIFLTILETTSVYSNSNILPIGILTLLCFVSTIYFLLSIVEKKTVKKNKFFVFLLYLLYIILYLIFSVDTNNYLNFIMKFLYLVMIYYFVIESIDDLKRFIKKYCIVITIICCMSLFFYVFGYLFNLLPVNYNVILNWGNTKTVGSIFNLHFLIQTENFFGYSIIRNTGLFCEAPMFMLNLVMALSANLFCVSNKNKLANLILAIGIITTLSSIGYISLIIIITLYFFINNKFNVKFLFIPILLLISVFLITNVIETKSSTRSYSVRYDDYIASIESWKENILFGNGYKNNDVFLSKISSFRYTNTGQSSSVGAILSQGGIYLFFIYIMSFISIYKFSKYNKSIKFFALIYLMLLFLTVFQYTALELFIIACSLNLKSLNCVEGEI